MGEENELLHTEEIKKRYHHVENEIKRSLTELLLLSRIGSDNYSTRGLSFTKDFSIRELTEEENPKYKSNPSTIKRETLYKTTEEFKNNILYLLNEQVEDEKIRQKYIDGIEDFFTHYLSQNITGNLLKMISKHKNSSLFFKYLIQTNSIPDEGKKTIGTKNIYQQLAKILFNRFGDDAFTVTTEKTKIQPPNGRNNYQKNGNGEYLIDSSGNYTVEHIYLSDKSLDYIFKIFSIANKVRESWGYQIDQVFHDDDFIRIIENKRAAEGYYIKALRYLLNNRRTLYYGKRGEVGQREWSRKTAQYADILRALTNNQLGIHNIETSGDEIPEFTRDAITKNLYTNGKNILDSIIKENGKKFTLSGRLKKIQSCVEKIIEGKRLNDIIGFRLTMDSTNNFNYKDIKRIGLNFLKQIKEIVTSDINTDITNPTYNYDNPSSSYYTYNETSNTNTDITNPAYNQLDNSYTGFFSTPTTSCIHTEKGQKIKIKNITIDNKGILTKNQLQDICSAFNEIVPTSIRKKPESPYVNINIWKNRMFKYYGDIIENDPEKRDTLQAFYKRITMGKSRGTNGDYKDFKFNITFEIKNENDETIGEKTMEVQFDDIRNIKGIQGHNIRDIERGTNTNSRLSFSQSLAQIRRRCEKALKRQRDELVDFCLKNNKTGEDRRKLFEIKFNDDLKKNIEDFIDRDPNNNRDLDETIVETINYFLSKGTFIFCFNPYIKQDQKESIKSIFKTGNPHKKKTRKELIKSITDMLHENKKQKDLTIGRKAKLTIDDLHNSELMDNLHICSVGELAAQQHSYLQKNRDVEVGIYIEEKNRIGRITTGELIQYMNLGKKKDKNFYVTP